MMIRPVSALQNDFKSLAAYCKEFDEPVFLTEDGAGEYVFMRMACYEKMNEMLTVQGKVLSAEADFYKDGTSYTLEEVDRMMREVIDAGA